LTKNAAESRHRGWPSVMPWSCELPRASYRIGQPLRHSAALVSESLMWTRVILDPAGQEGS
jgi:hypothetical protein